MKILTVARLDPKDDPLTPEMRKAWRQRLQAEKIISVPPPSTSIILSQQRKPSN